MIVGIIIIIIVVMTIIIIIIIYYSESYLTVHLTTTNVSSCNSLFLVFFFFFFSYTFLNIPSFGLAINFYLALCLSIPFPLFAYSFPLSRKNILYLFFFSLNKDPISTISTFFCVLTDHQE